MVLPIKRIYAMCWEREIDIRTTAGPIKVMGWTYGGLSVCNSTEFNNYYLTHLPTGLSMANAGVFDDQDTAVKAMVALAGGRNNWLIETEADRAEFAEAVRQVFEASKARPRVRVDPPKAGSFAQNDLNGFQD
jgi:hypothetical protein